MEYDEINQNMMNDFKKKVVTGVFNINIKAAIRR